MSAVPSSCSGRTPPGRSRVGATSEKIGHGTGVDFRELPWIAAGDEATLEPGTVLAYDYGADLDGYMLHVEDRVLVDATALAGCPMAGTCKTPEGFRRLLR